MWHTSLHELPGCIELRFGTPSRACIYALHVKVWPMSPESLFSLVILADADPVVLIRLIERVQSLMLVPERLSARWFGNDKLSIELVCAGLDETQIETLTQRVAQFTTVHSATWTRAAQFP
jgi:hypothetical protein